MPAPGSRTVLLADIQFGRDGDSDRYVQEGWGPVEPGHRWTVGHESRMALPACALQPRCILVINMMPWCDAECLPMQTVMLALDGRLLATVTLWDQRSLAFALPDVADARGLTLSFSHLNAGASRPAAGSDHAGQPLGLLVTSLRVFRLLGAAAPPALRAAFAGSLADQTLQPRITAATGLTPQALVEQFESIGLNCEFGLVQRAFGAEPLALLRFVMLLTHSLVDGLMTRFAGVGAPETTRIFLSDAPDCEFNVHEQLFYLWYNTRKGPDQITQQATEMEQCRRLRFLQRKFAEDLDEGRRIHVLTRPEEMTHAEALAVFCALGLHGPNTLLWTRPSDAATAGQVERLMPGLLCASLGEVDGVGYASWDVWLGVLANAYLLSR